MMKKHWKDKKGLGSLAMIGTIIVVVIICMVAVVYVAGGFSNTIDYDAPLKDGDTEEEYPVFAYFSVSTTLRFDNSRGLEPTIYGMVSISASYSTVPRTTQLFQGINPADWFVSHDCAYRVHFAITNPALADYSYNNDVTGNQHVGAAQNLVTPPIDMGTTPPIRYEGTYHIVITLYDGDDKQVSSLTKDLKVTK